MPIDHSFVPLGNMFPAGFIMGAEYEKRGQERGQSPGGTVPLTVPLTPSLQVH